MTGTYRHGHLQLRTVWLEHGHDLRGIIADLPNLRFLGIYFNHTNKQFWTKIKGLIQTTTSPRTTPTICMLKCYTPGRIMMSFDRLIPVVEIFPASHRPGEVALECREIARYLIEFPKGYFKRHHVSISFDLFGITNGNINVFIEVMEGMANCTQSYSSSLHITSLAFRIDDTTIKVRSRLSSCTRLVYSNRSHGASLDSLKPYRILEMQRILLSFFLANWSHSMQIYTYA